uniref:Fibronectin type III domain-containing protein 3B n=1 Tax=Daphnia magna TaxID=35525 RepID=A0A0P5L944_9CRUS
MAQVKSANSDEASPSSASSETTVHRNPKMPVASIPLCSETDHEEAKEKDQLVDEEEASGGDVVDSCHHRATSTSLILPPPSMGEDSLSVASPDSGHGTTGSHTESDVQLEHEVMMMMQQQQQQMEVTASKVHLVQHHHQQQQQASMAGMMGAILAEPGMLPLPPVDYSWMNGQQQQVHHRQHLQQQHHHGPVVHAPRVMEPVAINTETGFTTVLVDASAMAGYPHHQMPTAQATHSWPQHHHPVVGGQQHGYVHPHHHHAHPHHHHHHHHHVIGGPMGHPHHFQSQQQPQHHHPHPPPHFLHPHAYHDPMAAGMADYGGYLGGVGGGGYDSGLLAAPPYDPASGVIFDPTALHMGGGPAGGNGPPPTHLTAFGGSGKGGGGGPGGRNHRAGRGSSVSPKRPNHRSVSQNNSATQQRRASGQTHSSSGGGRYTPSPSSGRSRGSSPGVSTATTAAINNININNNNPPATNAANSGNPPMVILHSGSSSSCPPPPSAPGQHVVHLHVNPGETVSLQMGGQVQVIQGPATVRMVSTGSPPVPLPVQVPPGHVLQQIVDERGTLRHVILSPAPAATAAAVAAAVAAAAASNKQTTTADASTTTTTTSTTTPTISGAATAAPLQPPPPQQPNNLGVLPLATPPHPPPLPPHYGSTHGPPPTTTTPPLYYGSNGTGGGGVGYGGPPSLINHGASRPPHSQHHQQHHHHHPPAHGYNMSSSATNTTKGPSPSPPSPVNYQNERLQRQSAKLRKKLESRSSKTGSGVTMAVLNPTTSSAMETPPTSPKKDNNNIRKLKDRNQNGMPEISLPSGGQDQHHQAEAATKKNHQEALAERITELAAPQVGDIDSTSATVSWKPVEPVILEPITPMELAKNSVGLDVLYEAVIGQKTGASKSSSPQEKCSYRGKECHFRLMDLQPGMDYWIRVSALVDELKVKDAPVVEFRTDACRPGTPFSPKLQNRTRNSLLLRWSSPADNGSPIVHYILECDDGSGNDRYSEAYRGRNKQFTISKLQSSTCYAIRLAACNEIGASEWSPVLKATTMGAPPPPPLPPTLRSASAKQMMLMWGGPTSPADMLYTLQMADPDSGHGFLNVYHGPDNEYACTALTRSTAYRFRLQAQNDDGLSRWSEETTLSTTADRPAAPARPSVKGRIQAHSFRVRWDPPLDTGGAPVKQYSLEIDSGAGFSPVWNGAETEFTCDKLTPGTTYRVRISCFNGQEHSDVSETLIVTTEPVCPGASAVPHLVGKVRPTSLQLGWAKPEYDGGSLVTQYEVNMINPDSSTRIVFSGYETECLVASLLPGRCYAFQVRASNRIGFGPWSESFEIKSGPGVPSAPVQPLVTNRSAHSVSLVWNEPDNNGSAVHEYRLEMAPHPRVTKSPSVCSLNDSAEVQTNGHAEESVDLDQLIFTPYHSGPAKQLEVKGLHPWTTYHFRVQAVNAIGVSVFSPVSSVTTLASSPASVSGLRCTSVTATSLSLSWNVPHCNGSSITHYNVEIGDRGTFPTNDASTTFDANYLTPDTTYRVRVQAANAIGVGPYSTAFKFSTRPLPPDAPRLECVQANHNSLKLRWADGKNLDFIHYSVEMQEDGSDKYYLVYEGTSHSYRVPKLKESTSYTFRICARNEVGEGPYSEEVVFTTTRAPPPTLKKPEVLDLTETSCRIVWSAYRLPVSSDSVIYLVEVIRTRDSQEPIVTRRCSESEMAVDGLESRTEYAVRVCPIRLCQDGEIPGAYSPLKTFCTPSSQAEQQTTIDSQQNSSSQMANKMPRRLTDQHVVLIIIAAIIVIAIMIAVVMDHFGVK